MEEVASESKKLFFVTILKCNNSSDNSWSGSYIIYGGENSARPLKLAAMDMIFRFAEGEKLVRKFRKLYVILYQIERRAVVGFIIFLAFVVRVKNSSGQQNLSHN